MFDKCYNASLEAAGCGFKHLGSSAVDIRVEFKSDTHIMMPNRGFETLRDLTVRRLTP